MDVCFIFYVFRLLGMFYFKLFWFSFLIFFSFFFWYSKSNLKLLKVRLEGIKKKKNAVQKYLKSDIVDLLRNNLDINAYGRVSFSIICFSQYEIQYLFFPSFSMILWPWLVFFSFSFGSPFHNFGLRRFCLLS